VNTCAGCLPKVTGVQRLLPVLAARQKLPPETAAERKLLTIGHEDKCYHNGLQAQHPVSVATPASHTTIAVQSVHICRCSSIRCIRSSSPFPAREHSAQSGRICSQRETVRLLSDYRPTPHNRAAMMRAERLFPPFYWEFHWQLTLMANSDDLVLHAPPP